MRRWISLLSPAAGAVATGAVFVLIAVLDAGNLAPELRGGAVVWTCQHPW